MESAALRTLQLDKHFQIHGVAATVTRPSPDDTPISTRVIWPTPNTDDIPGGFGVRSADVKRVALLRRDQVPTVPKSTRIEAPLEDGGAEKAWIVDSTDRVETDVTRVFVVETEP